MNANEMGGTTVAGGVMDLHVEEVDAPYGSPYDVQVEVGWYGVDGPRVPLCRRPEGGYALGGYGLSVAVFGSREQARQAARRFLDRAHVGARVHG